MNAEFRLNGKTITTPRLLLRPFRESDLEDFYAYASVEGVGEMAGWSHHESIEESRRILNDFIEGDKTFALCLRGSGRVVGSLGVEKYGMEDRLTEFDGLRGREIGCVLARDCWGQGLMPEAAEAVIRWLFEDLGLDFLLYGYFDFNAQSRRVQEKLGFRPYRLLNFSTQRGTEETGVLNLLVNPAKNITLRFSHPETLIYPDSPQNVLARLFSLRDTSYADFIAKLVPTVPRERFIGVRVPDLRALAREMKKDGGADAFLERLPHRYYEENLLHALLLSEIRDFDSCVQKTERFLPFVDNWAACDTLLPKAFGKKKDALLPLALGWTASEQVYTCRFGLNMLMKHFLDEDFRPEVLEAAAAVRNEDYYVKMAQAWFFATALTKQWDAALPYLTERRLSPWVHNKTIQKARESFRVSDEKKELLSALRVREKTERPRD